VGELMPKKTSGKLVDFPGFEETNGDETDIATSLYVE